MIENLKLMLNLNDSKYDDLINLYLTKFETVVIAYTKVDVLDSVLESFIEDKVYNIMKPIVSGGNQNTGEIKSVSRGDTKIDYNVGSAIIDTSKGAILTESDKKYLNSFRPQNWRLV